MRQNTINILSLFALSSIVSAGVIKRTTCYKDGIEIPCIKAVKSDQESIDNENENKQKKR
jgi:hypothetical protein